MAASLGPVMAMTGITLVNDVIVHRVDIQREQRVIVAGAVVAATLALVEKAAPELAVNVAWLGLITVLLVRVTPGVPSPVESFVAWYNAK